METIIFESELYSYVVLLPTRSEEAYRIVVEGFADEPVVAHTEPDRNKRIVEFAELSRIFATECSSNNMSVACIEKTTDTLVGVLWTRDFCASFPPDLKVADFPVVLPLLSALMKVENDYCELRPNIRHGECLDLWMLAVHPNHRGKGIAKALTIHTIDWVECNSEYLHIVMETSGGYSARCAENAGMHEIVAFPYVQLDYEAFNNILAIHSSMRLWELSIAEKKRKHEK